MLLNLAIRYGRFNVGYKGLPRCPEQRRVQVAMARWASATNRVTLSPGLENGFRPAKFLKPDNALVVQTGLRKDSETRD